MSNLSLTDDLRSNGVCIVTGANKGIGYYIAQQILKSGKYAYVVIACRDKQRGETAVQQLSNTTGSSPSKPIFLQLDVSSKHSAQQFVQEYSTRFNNRCDCLVNNAAIAFKQADPTPFEGQTAPTLQTNLYGTLDFTEMMLPLLINQQSQSQSSSQTQYDKRIVNVASMAGHLSQLRSNELKNRFVNARNLNEIRQLASEFATDVANGNHQQKGWGNSNYGLSKLALIAATNVIARQYINNGQNGILLKANSCCPGYCKTDMSSNRGGQSPEVGARNASILVLTPWEECPSGVFVKNEQIAKW